MSKQIATALTTNPRRPTAKEVHAVGDRSRRWAESTPNVHSIDLFTHRERPTVRVAVVSRSRDYDPILDEAVTRLDLGLAQDPALGGIDVEIRLFFAEAPEQVGAWARGWEPWTDA
jgi:hypothetical protein